jgi:eukaryotic-like serine/threonine-protein kinase
LHTDRLTSPAAREPSAEHTVEAVSLTPSPYILVSTIGKGGMGYVELCFRREGRFLRWAARKRLHVHWRSDSHFRSMFMDEARLAGLVRHPNVVSVSDVGEDADGPYLIMDYVDGLSLSQLARNAARAARPIPVQIAVRICKEVAIGLDAAHEVRAEDGTLLNLVHRDVSPQNILIGFDGSVRVTDFGIAKARGNVDETTTGVLKGNVGYLSPEQLRFDEVDRRSDLFSLGVTLYELLSGGRLYPNVSGSRAARRILTEIPPDLRSVRPTAPVALVELQKELLQKQPIDRPATGRDVAGRLEKILMAVIATEGPLTIAEYMDRHFADTRDQRRATLVKRLRGLERRLPVRAQSTRVPDGTRVTKLERPRAPAPRPWPAIVTFVVVGAAAAAAGVGVVARQTSRGSPPDAATRAIPTTTGPRIEVVAQPAAEHGKPSPVVNWSAAPAARRNQSKRRERSRRVHHGASKPVGGGHQGPVDLGVPLFTKWR